MESSISTYLDVTRAAQSCPQPPAISAVLARARQLVIQDQMARVLAAVRDGAGDPGAIARRTGYTAEVVTQRIAGLQEMGLVEAGDETLRLSADAARELA